MIQNEKFVVAAVCDEKEDTCSSLGVLGENKAVVPLMILACQKVVSDDDYYQEEVHNFEKELLSHLLSALVLEEHDDSCIWSESVRFANRLQGLNDLQQLYGIAILFSPAEEQWKRNLMDRHAPWISWQTLTAFVTDLQWSLRMSIRSCSHLVRVSQPRSCYPGRRWILRKVERP